MPRIDMKLESYAKTYIDLLAIGILSLKGINVAWNQILTQEELNAGKRIIIDDHLSSLNNLIGLVDIQTNNNYRHARDYGTLVEYGLDNILEHTFLIHIAMRVAFGDDVNIEAFVAKWFCQEP